MAHVDHSRCLFTVVPQSGTEPTMIHFEFLDGAPSALERPQRHVFFALKPGISWQQAEELAVQLNRTVATMNLAEYALGARRRNIF